MQIETCNSPPASYTLKVTKAGLGAGVVTSNPVGIHCPEDCQEAYDSGTVVALTPTPENGSTFAGWSGDADCGDGQVTMTANRNCTATFNSGHGNVLNVMDFGAIPNDGGDDINAIRAALQAAVAGNIIYFPAGHYDISDSINLPSSDLQLQGDGQDLTIIQYRGAAVKPIIFMEDYNNIEISAMTLDGDHTVPKAMAGIVALWGSGHHFHHLTIQNIHAADDWAPHGIRTLRLTDSWFYDNRIQNIAPHHDGSAGMLLGDSTRLHLTGNVIDNTGHAGIQCLTSETSPADIVIRANTVSQTGREIQDDSGLGIEINGCRRVIIEDNSLDHWLSLNGADYCAVRRNTIHDGSYFKFSGVEFGNTRHCVLTDNAVTAGAQIGISIAGAEPKNYVYWAYNTVQHARTWGAQLQGETSGVRYHYFYGNQFQWTDKDHPQALYADNGHGFRLNGDVYQLTLDSNRIQDNGDAGIQTSDRIDQLSVVNNQITGNGGDSITADPPAVDLEWANNTVQNNGQNRQLVSRGFSNQQPTASFQDAPGGSAAVIRFTSTASDPDGHIAHLLWDFGDGAPVAWDQDDGPLPAYFEHVYPAAGTYRVTLLVWDNGGRAARTERSLVVDPGGSSGDPELRVGQVCGLLGGQVTLPISLLKQGQPVASTGFTLAFSAAGLACDPANPPGFGCSPAATAKGFNCSRGTVDCVAGTVEVLVTPPSTIPVPELPDGDIAQFLFQVDASAHPGTAPLCSTEPPECGLLSLQGLECGSTSAVDIPCFPKPGCVDVLACQQGDCNGDGKLTSADVTCTILRIFEAMAPLSACEDCNGDGKLTSADVTCGILCIFGQCPAKP